MKKILTYAIILTLVALITIAGTYAAFTASTSSQQIDIGAHQIQVIYDGDEKIDGYIELVKTKEEGFRRIISIGLGEDSVDTDGNIYFYLDEISEGLASKALKWEIYKLNNETETLVQKGTFEGCESGDKVYVLQNLNLTEDIQQFAVYLWLNGYEAGNEVHGASLRGFIGAESGIVSGITSE